MIPLKTLSTLYQDYSHLVPPKSMRSQLEKLKNIFTIMMSSSRNLKAAGSFDTGRRINRRQN